MSANQVMEGRTVDVKIVDTDVHPSPQSGEELRSYVPEPWRSRQWPSQVFDAVESPIYVAPGKAQRRDSYPPSGGPPCSDPGFAQKQLFDEAGVDLAILLPLTARPVANPEHEAAVCAATNAWLEDTWLTRYNGHGRFRGSIRVTSNDPTLAVQEIERWAGHPMFVQVMLIPYTLAPLGQPQYQPIFETAARHGLPVSIHVNRGPGARLLTPVGFASYFIEHHALYPLLYATHLASLIFEGVFDRFPSLRVVFAEGGFAWLAPFMWRLDRHYAALHSEVPWLKRKPSEIICEQVRFTSQPLEEPEDLWRFQELFDAIDGERILMFATDYPHWDFDNPLWVANRLPKTSRARVLRSNAIDLYKLPTTRPAGPVPAGVGV